MEGPLNNLKTSMVVLQRPNKVRGKGRKGGVWGGGGGGGGGGERREGGGKARCALKVGPTHVTRL